MQAQTKPEAPPKETVWWDIQLPKNIVAKQPDTVSYNAIQNDNSAKTSHNGAACYAGHMSRLPQYCFECLPYNTNTSILPECDYLKWMKLCVDNGIMPLSSEFWSENSKNYARIPGKHETKHRIYSALCCYRWTECLAPLCYNVLRLLEAKSTLDFYQALHYSLGKFNPGWGHSFSSICAASSLNAYMANFGLAKIASTDLMYGLGLRLFFERRSEGCLASKAPQNTYTYTAIDTVVTGFGLQLPVKKREDLLEDKWTALYQMPDPTKDKVKEYYNRMK